MVQWQIIDGEQHGETERFTHKHLGVPILVPRQPRIIEKHVRAPQHQFIAQDVVHRLPELWIRAEFVQHGKVHVPITRGGDT